MKRFDPFSVLLLSVFALSGFSGLVYESVWSHYLGLYLGHAAYAQSLVLVIFMGGLAIGAWLVGSRSESRPNPLMDYAIVEGVIGLMALLFHVTFVWLTDVTHASIAPALGAGWMVSAFKWTAGGLLILPQSILLGMTFPLISAALVRRNRERGGATISVLYFANSIGAAFGVLAAAFYLMPNVGLPGAMLIAGVLNVVIGLFVYLMSKGILDEPTRATVSGDVRDRRFLQLILAVAAMTGAASFVYEMAWIRMLSLALGTTLHAFEIMLSAFIFGLALGGLWIRKRLDHLEDPQRFTGLVQIIMAVMALCSLLVYSRSFEWVADLIAMLAPTDQGYAAYNLASHVIAMLVMVPTTFMAGMTLPLLTFMLVKRGHGEISIGRVYASNTLGAILGVLFAVHIGFPVLGLEWLMGFGALIDLVAGAALLLLWPRVTESFIPRAAIALGALALLMLPEFGRLDRITMSSGVYRTGSTLENVELEFLEHGKTATVSVTRTESGARIIATNGKPDASIAMAPGAAPVADEATMVMLGSIPLYYHPEATSAAIVGFGCGMTTHTLLGSPKLERVDTIEIEPAMVEGARLFQPAVQRAFDDPRSVVHFEDAKTFFAKQGQRYDLIISEPSNPWVSGVASLFTDEYYGQVSRYLNEDGLFIQWLQLYEIDDTLITSVIRALNLNFADYRAYYADQTDLVIIASPNGPLPEPSDELFKFAELRPLLSRIRIESTVDFDVRLAGDAQMISAIYGGFNVPANSDYFPILSLRAPATRFKRSSPELLFASARSSLPIRHLLLGTEDGTVQPNPAVAVASQRLFGADLLKRMQAGAIPEALKDSSADPQPIQLGLTWERHVGFLQGQLQRCAFDDMTRYTLQQLAENTLPASPSGLRNSFWNERTWLQCTPDPELLRQLSLYAALASLDPPRIASAAADVIANATDDSERRVVGYAWLALQLSRIVGVNLEGLSMESEGVARELARLEFPQDSELVDAIWLTLRTTAAGR